MFNSLSYNCVKFIDDMTIDKLNQQNYMKFVCHYILLGTHKKFMKKSVISNVNP